MNNENNDKLSFDSIRKSGNLLFESIRGSHLFGLNTESSDIDTFGVFIGPKDWFFGLGKDKELIIKSEKSDDYWDELEKYFIELSNSNPEALVSLFTPDKFILYFDPILQPLWDIRNSLITKKCFKPFAGYAFSQIKKAKGLKKAINIDPEKVKERKTPLDFCQVPVGIGSHTLTKWLNDHNLKQKYCGVARYPNSIELYSLFYDYGADENYKNLNKKEIGYRGVIDENDKLTSQIRLSSIPKNETPLCVFQFNSNAYSSHCIDYKRYWEWVNNRNQKRFNLNKGYDFDCYLDSETEFLTNNGWKKFDDVSESDLIGCFDFEGNIKYEHFISRTDQIYTGDIYTYENKRTKFSITPNHKLFILDGDTWKLIKIEELINQNKKVYQLVNLNNNLLDFNISEDYIKLLALFISKGIIIYENNNPILVKLIYPKKKSKYVHNIIKNLSTETRSYIKKDKIIWEIRDKSFINIVLKCKYRKNLPNILFSFSESQFNIFFTTYLKSECIFSNSKKKNYDISFDHFKLAEDFYNLLILNNYSVNLTRVINKEENDKIYYKLRIDYKKKTISEVDFSKIKKIFVNNQRIVCFETKYGTLITRNSHKLCFHGNSKNMCHCVRILTMAKEIAQGKGMILDRTDIDKEWLLKIKNHQVNYDELMKYVDSLNDGMLEEFEKSNLPDEPDVDKLNKILIKIRESHYSKEK